MAAIGTGRHWRASSTNSCEWPQTHRVPPTTSNGRAEMPRKCKRATSGYSHSPHTSDCRRRARGKNMRALWTSSQSTRTHSQWTYACAAIRRHYYYHSVGSAYRESHLPSSGIVSCQFATRFCTQRLSHRLNHFPFVSVKKQCCAEANRPAVDAESPAALQHALQHWTVDSPSRSAASTNAEGKL